MDYKEEFLSIFRENVTRPGADKLLEWLCNTDFFTAPASTRFHGACECGLVMHSLNVYHVLMKRYFDEAEDNKETFTLVSLLHDLCKANYYKPGFRNVKNDATGQWDAVRGGSFTISNAYDEYPLAVKLHLADLEATYLVEKGTSSVNRR